MVINIQNVSKTYKVGDESVQALKNITLNIESGEFLVIVGPSGSGKSTLLHLLGGLTRPTFGEIIVDKQNIRELKDNELSNYRNTKIGFIFQDFKLHPNLNILENVKLPMLFKQRGLFKEHTADKTAYELLEMVGLKDRAAHLPHQISGGQKQRAAIARAVVNNPSLLLADEPMGDLDPITGGKIIRVLRDLHKRKKMTLVVVTHDYSIAKFASRTIEINNGMLVAKNSFKKFIT